MMTPAPVQRAAVRSVLIAHGGTPAPLHASCRRLRPHCTASPLSCLDPQRYPEALPARFHYSGGRRLPPTAVSKLFLYSTLTLHSLGLLISGRLPPRCCLDNKSSPPVNPSRNCLPTRWSPTVELIPLPALLLAGITLGAALAAPVIALGRVRRGEAPTRVLLSTGLFAVIALQLAAGLLLLDTTWPLTGYPMYAMHIPRGAAVEVLLLEGTTRSGSVIEIPGGSLFADPLDLQARVMPLLR